MSNFSSFSYFQTALSLGVGQVLQKLPKFDINDLKLLFHCYILIPRKCPRKTQFKTQCPPPIFRQFGVSELHILNIELLKVWLTEGGFYCYFTSIGKTQFHLIIPIVDAICTSLECKVMAAALLFFKEKHLEMEMKKEKYIWRGM